MMCKWLVVVGGAVIVLASGCAKKGVNRGEMESELRASTPSFASGGLSVEEIAKLKPQIKLPVNLAVSGPAGTVHYYRSGESNAWNASELAEIESWEEPLRQAGVISEAVVLPAILVEACGYN